ncbi:hypothetical protein K438DRAFT_1935651 [Mycena galopus ATCC 62051]|nr:hypothetical protein K438DRAFT_1935651 [Mycena galopus ATCC 62051]
MVFLSFKPKYSLWGQDYQDSPDFCSVYTYSLPELQRKDKTRVEKLIELIQKELAYFRLFQGAWPIRAMIKQYLRNAGDKLRRDLRKEHAAEKDDIDPPEAPSSPKGAQRVDGDNVMEEDEDEDEDTIWLDDNEDNDIEDIEDGAPAEDADADMEHERQDVEDHLAFDDDSTGESEETLLRAASWMESPTPKKQKSAYKENVSAVKKDIQVKGGRRVIPDSPINSPSPTKRKREDVAPVKSKKTKLDPVTPATAPTTTAPPTSIPDVCPASHCGDRVPENPPHHILSLFIRRRDHISKNGRGASGLSQLNREVCFALKHEKRKVELRLEAQRNQWPVKIDFEDLRSRCQAPDLQDKIVNTAIDKKTLGKAAIWKGFLKNIGYKIHGFGLAEIGTFSVDADRAARCGYFGPRGQSIISIAVKSTLKSNGVTPDHTYSTIVAALQDSPEQLDASSNDETLPSQDHFVHYILVPLVAATLIAEDFEVHREDGFTIMHESSDFGDVFNPNSIPVVDPRKIASKSATVIPGPSEEPTKMTVIPSSKELKKAGEGKKATPKAPPGSVKTTTMMSFPAPIIAKKKSTQVGFPLHPGAPALNTKAKPHKAAQETTPIAETTLIFLRTTLEIHV